MKNVNSETLDKSQKNTANSWMRIFPWALSGVLVLAMLVTAVFVKPPTPLGNYYDKTELLSNMRIHLLEASEAEKNAVLALQVKSAKEFVTQARQASQALEGERVKLSALVEQEQIPKQLAMLKEFDACWSQYRELDQTLLELATQGTNLEAKKISSTECAQALEKLEASLNHVMQSYPTQTQISHFAQEALIAAFKIQTLHAPHIETPSDSVMDAFEKKITAFAATARQDLHTLIGITPGPGQKDLTQANQAFEEFTSQTARVLKLSRQNSNVKSVDLSLGKKKLISSQCQTSLNSLEETVKEQEFKATR